jgi:hypothetical protein
MLVPFAYAPEGRPARHDAAAAPEAGSGRGGGTDHAAGVRRSDHGDDCLRGGVTYGSAIAALVATMGDASWVLLAADPVLTVQLKTMLLVVGSLTGYLVDAVGIQPRRSRQLTQTVTVLTPVVSGPPLRTAPAFLSVGVLPILLWLSLGAGVTISVPVTFQLAPASDLYLSVGLIGTGLAFVSFIRNRGRLADDDVSSARPSTMAASLSHGVHEVAFVTVWVAVAYLAWSAATNLTRFDGSQLPLWGVAGVLVGACIGLIPGCAVQIVFAGMFAAGGLPLPTLAAKTVSQDGDALLPLLALEHRSALLATVLTTLPALVVGGGFLLLT